MNTTDIKLDISKLPITSGLLEETEDGDAWESGAGDMLATIFAGQRQLMEEYETIERGNGCVVVTPAAFGHLDMREVQMRLKDLAYRVVEELSEATNCLKNKPWKQSFVATDEEHFREELADALHFFVELLITAGMSAEDVFKIYFRKHAVNQFRQESKY
jgi:hypothetical protein